MTPVVALEQPGSGVAVKGLRSAVGSALLGLHAWIKHCPFQRFASHKILSLRLRISVDREDSVSIKLRSIVTLCARGQAPRRDENQPLITSDTSVLFSRCSTAALMQPRKMASSVVSSHQSM